MDIGFIVFTIILLIGTWAVKWKRMKTTGSKALFITVIGLIAVLIIICIDHGTYSLMNIAVMRDMVMGIYGVMRGQEG